MSTKGVRVNLSLPEPFATELRGLYSWGGKPSAELCATVAAAKKRGWSWMALGNALGAADPDQPVTLDIPDLPPLPEPFRRVIPTLTQEQAQQLRDLRHQAMAMGCKTAERPEIVAGHRLAVLVNGYVKAGHRLTDIAADIGMTPGGLRFRLARWGFYSLPPSQQHGPGGINQFRQRQEVSDVR